MIWLTLMKEKALVCSECFCCKENIIFLCGSILCHKVESFHMRKSISLLCVIPISTNKQQHFLTQLNVLTKRLCSKPYVFHITNSLKKMPIFDVINFQRADSFFQFKAYSPGFYCFQILSSLVLIPTKENAVSLF